MKIHAINVITPLFYCKIKRKIKAGVQAMTPRAQTKGNRPHSDYYGAGYSVFFREDKLLSYSEIYNWWKMKRIISKMIEGERFRKNREYNLLDMGCSRGHDIFRINREFNQYNLKFTGYDIIPQDIEYANKVAKQKGLKNVNFKVANAENPGFEDDTFDIITCSEVMEHQKKPKQVLSECFRILRPGGIIIITTPNMAYKTLMPKGMKNRIRKRMHNKVDLPKNLGEHKQGLPYEKHVFVININEWVRLLRAIGFEIEELKRGSLVYGGPIYDRHVKTMGALFFLDNILDYLTHNYSWNIVIKARKTTK
ncbi:MAG: class I SAM-dependent methyltransferase [Methanomassiliicoccales archaeon]|nr:MAG: class I SAM-dependent methyltransferase [Methanomassiliicoccales archaeon]